MSSTWVVGFLWALFIVSHLVVSHPTVRQPLVARLGRNGFALAYSAKSLLIFVPLAVVWWTNRHDGGWLWYLRDQPVAVHAAELLGVLGFALVGGTLPAPAPSAMMSGVKEGVELEVRGMNAITRHPAFVGMSLWALGHLLMNGNATSVVWWAGFPLLTLAGGLHQDARKAAESPAYAAYLDKTSFLPGFRLPRPSEIGLKPAIGAVVGATIAVVVRVLHT